MKQRALGNYERYSLARHNVGHAPAVVFTARLASSSLTSHRLETAVETLLEREPLLSCAVGDPASETPHFTLQRDVEPSRVVVELDTIGHSGSGSDDDALLDGLEAINSLDIERAPLWRVFVYRPDPDSRRTRIALATHHTLCDGTASRNLFVQVVTLVLHPASLKPSNPGTSPFPPSLEETVDVTVSKSRLLGTVFSSLVAPYLPSFLYTPPTPCWPNPAIVSPLSCPTALKSFFLPIELSLALSPVVKSHSVKTLHPVFVTAAAASIAIVATRRGGAPLVVTSQSPVSLRSAAALGHTSSVTGNYVSSIEHTLPVITTPEYLESGPSFWTETLRWAEHAQKPTTLRHATESMGLLAYLPKTTDRDRERGRTGWESYLERVMESRDKNPWRGGSFEVSNLGRMSGFGDEDNDAATVRDHQVTDVCWAQPASGTGPALSFNTVSYGGVLSCTVSWRKGAIDTDTVEEIVRTFEAVLTRIAKGEIDDDTSFANLVQ